MGRGVPWGRGCRPADRAAAARAQPQPARRPRAGGLRHGDAGRPRGHDASGSPASTAWRSSRSSRNHEGELVDAIHGARRRCAAIIINPGAFTHYAWSIHDALAAFDGPVVEVHLSNPNAREPWRHTSVVAPVATGSIVGFGGLGYELAAARRRRSCWGAGA